MSTYDRVTEALRDCKMKSRLKRAEMEKQFADSIRRAKIEIEEMMKQNTGAKI